VVPVVQPAESAVTAAADAVLDHVRREGGAVAKSERGLARLIGQPRSTVRRAVHLLVAGGLLAIEASRSGSVLRLVA
jgi:DNA-binding IclR family transcriptional regulator